MKRDPEIENYKRALGIVMDALELYARPNSYHAIAFMADRPAGAFADDFSRIKDSVIYNRPMPGKAARKAFAELARKFPSLSYWSRGVALTPRQHIG